MTVVLRLKKRGGLPTLWQPPLEPPRGYVASSVRNTKAKVSEQPFGPWTCGSSASRFAEPDPGSPRLSVKVLVLCQVPDRSRVKPT